MQTKVSKARDLLITGDLDGADYRDIKLKGEQQIALLEGKLVELSAQQNRGIGPLLDKGLKNISRLPELYENADTEDKRRIISSVYPEKLTFDGSEHRTTRINEAIRVFNAVKAILEQKNTGKPIKKTDLPVKVARNRIELYGY